MKRMPKRRSKSAFRSFALITVVVAGCVTPTEREDTSQQAEALLTGATDPGVCVSVSSQDHRRELYETSLEVLTVGEGEEGTASRVTMGQVLNAVAAADSLSEAPVATAATSSAGHILFDQLWDSFSTGCSDHGAAYEECDRAESILSGNSAVSAEVDFMSDEHWQTIAFVNRVDLAAADWSHCGEQRLTMALTPNSRGIVNGLSQQFPGDAYVIFEAQIPNPTPGDSAGCFPLAQFWDDLRSVGDAEQRAARLQEAFLGGEGFSSSLLGQKGFAPFMRASHFGLGRGHIRTNTAVQLPWTLRQYRIDVNTEGEASITPEKVSNNFSHDLLSSPLDEEGDVGACAQAFFDNVTTCSLLFAGSCTQENTSTHADLLSGLSLTMPDACGSWESADSAANGNPGLKVSAEFEAMLSSVIDGPTTDGGLGAATVNVDVLDVVERAQWVGNCMGCHASATDNDVGVELDVLEEELSTPPSLGFVHTAIDQHEVGCGGENGTYYRLSEALTSWFLPARRDNMEQLFASHGFKCGDVDGNQLINIADVVRTIHVILGLIEDDNMAVVGDVNDDGQLNITDVMTMVFHITKGAGISCQAGRDTLATVSE